jgi:hypothetical protein
VPRQLRAQRLNQRAHLRSSPTTARASLTGLPCQRAGWRSRRPPAVRGGTQRTSLPTPTHVISPARRRSHVGAVRSALSCACGGNGRGKGHTPVTLARMEFAGPPNDGVRPVTVTRTTGVPVRTTASSSCSCAPGRSSESRSPHLQSQQKHRCGQRRAGARPSNR